MVSKLYVASRSFVHGHTYQGHPVGCAAALEVQRIIQEENLLTNVRAMGGLLERQLKERLSQHPNVGDIRGRGLFWGIEFVANKETKEAFPAHDHVSMAISERGLKPEYGIMVYPGAGSADDGVHGDHIIISPAFNINADEIKWIAETVARLIEDYFSELYSR
jgi:adenosylmethionine-8-amino-7-oxononanoate aminotransferase